MSFLVTPRQLEHRAEFYYQLQAMISAGVALPQALEMLERAPPSVSYRQPLARLRDALNSGHTFTEALTRLGRWLPNFDISLLHAGEQSGRLDSCLRLLSDYYRNRAQLLREILSAIAYPVLLLHFAIFVFAGDLAALVWQGQVSRYVGQILSVLLPIYGVAAVVIYACQGRHGEWWRALMEKLTRLVPVLGSGRQELALARLCAALEALITAGVSIIQAWDLAAEASGSPTLRRTVAGWQPRLLAGQTPSEAVSTSARFPEVFVSLYSTGELTGKLDETLRRLHVLYQDSSTRKFKAFAKFSLKFFYMAILFAIAFKIISFWMGYFSFEALEGL